MTTKLESRRRLRSLLDELVAAQKEDICAYSSGHLNESKLFTPRQPVSSQRATWTSSRSRSVLQHKTVAAKNTNSGKMQNALKSVAMPLEGGVSSRNGTKASLRSAKTDRIFSDVDDTTAKFVDSILPDYSEDEKVMHRLLGENGQLLPRHLESLTKTEEFNKFRAYENDVFEKEKLLRRGFGSGKETVDQLENRLDTDLEQLEIHGFGPGFHQLEAYSKAFDELISTSPAFGPLLEAMKRAYDDFLSDLLEGHVTRHKILQGQLSQLTDAHSANVNAIKDEARTVEKLEQQAKRALLENNRLKEELLKEQELANQPAPVVVKPTTVRRPEPSERIETLNGAICDIMDRTKRLREKIRTGCVPTTVCTYLRCCIKETNTDIQQMTSQKEYYERSIAELTADLREAIETADTTERDARKIWKALELQTKTVAPSLNAAGFWGGVAHASGPAKDGTDVYEDDESDKWNWYIS